MGFQGSGSGKERPWRIQSLMRRKQADSLLDRAKTDAGASQLAKELSVFQLIGIGVGSTIGAGVYVLVGTVAREHSGPSLMLSFLIAGIAAALAAFCYAELASRCPSAGSAYHYSYICVGEGAAWLIGWALILEYTIGGSAVARGISPNLALFFGGPNSLPAFLSRVYIPGLDVVVDPCAAVLVLIVTGLLCLGIKESSSVQAVVTSLNVCVMLFVIIVGGYICFQSGWVGYSVASGFFPHGVNGMLAGSATVFFAYIGFDIIASTAEEVKNPHRDLPLGIAMSVSICCLLYMMVSIVVVGMVPYFSMDPDTPISSAFVEHGMHWAMYVVSAGAVLALCSTLLGSILPQPRILMAMARDGLLPSFFSDVNERSQVPVKGTIITGVSAAILAFFMDVSQLSGMVSVGTLLAFTIVAISILILRYIPPDEVPLPPSLHQSIEPLYFIFSGEENDKELPKDLIGVNDNETQSSGDVTSIDYPLLRKDNNLYKVNELKRRKHAAWSIASVCTGILILTSSASTSSLPEYLFYSACSLGTLLFLAGLLVLSWIEQDGDRHSFGHAGGFICPLVPFLPVCCILINTYLLINLGADTWLRVSVWLLIGVFVYAFYGRSHSSLTDMVYVPVARAHEIHRKSTGHAV
ncbi:Cationic amino acid transporter 2, vacuolar [Platanthera guangdongensis]|uniref:Cationic amino acid transporter 2, vacuolar n=1 Tax=Platanthera guangdongensis TaxID=2320717 RepID=A0ABR2MHX3_9ASPA